MPAKRKPPAAAKTKNGAAKKTSQNADMDRRWAILLFGLGLFFAVLAVVPGESAWAFIRTNILFGAFGVSGWLLGPLLIWWAVLASLEKPVFMPIIKSVVFLFALSGVVLVFSPIDFEGLTFGEVLAALLESGRSGAFGGGIVSLVLGASLLALTGRIVARILIILLFLIAVMVLTGVTPGDIARFFGRIGDRMAERMDRQAEDEYVEESAGGKPEPPRAAPAAPPARRAQAVPVLKAPPRRMRVVDVPLRGAAVDIDLGPDGPAVQPGGAHSEPVEIGPGGTFGQKGLENTGTGLGDDYVPLIPFNSTSAEKTPQPAEGSMLLFGQDDPYAHLGGENSKLPPGTLLNVEYIPPPAPQFDLFGSPVSAAAGGQSDEAPTAASFEGAIPAPEPDPAVKADPATEPDPAAGTGSPSVDELIEKATPKKQGVPAGGAREPEPTGQPYRTPPIDAFDKAPPEATGGIREEMKRTADLLVSTLASFGVETRILDISRGPSVTRYEVQPQAGVKISRITNLSDDIALNLAAAGVRIEAPIPGKPAVGIEVPNKVKSTVSIRSILESNVFASATSPLSIALGRDIAGDAVVTDLTKMPHLLIAGSTGSGKSVCVNSIIMSFVYKSSPEDVKMILIDPKVVELAEYNGIPHLRIPVVTEPRMAAKALGQAVVEMEQRYHTFAQYNVREINSYNKLAQRGGSMEKMPHIAIIIDELADLMMTAGKDVENYICRIAQKARAAGMHLIVATQRPSVDVITGLIKANIPSRIAFATSSQVDSRTILDGAGAEKLLGMGDMLFMPIGVNKPVRVQGTYVKDREISAVLKFVKTGGAAQYDEDFLAEMDKVQLSGAAGAADMDADDEDGDLFGDQVFINAVETALEAGQISTSFLQRRLRLGYARAGRIMDQMERLRIISEPEGSKPRQVLITRQQWQEMVMNAQR